MVLICVLGSSFLKVFPLSRIRFRFTINQLLIKLIYGNNELIIYVLTRESPIMTNHWAVKSGSLLRIGMKDNGVFSKCEFAIINKNDVLSI
jgi:hypothetical protein|tara:strand:- start:206 stop:478 length:273 start_codon:yes stop_codon:yes gene_type:complete